MDGVKVGFKNIDELSNLCQRVLLSLYHSVNIFHSDLHLTSKQIKNARTLQLLQTKGLFFLVELLNYTCNLLDFEASLRINRLNGCVLIQIFSASDNLVFCLEALR